VSADEFNRKMEFIVEQQAQFAVDIQEIKDRLTVLVDVASTGLEIATRAAEISSQIGERVLQITDRVSDVAESQRRADERLDRLVAWAELTNDRLDRLVQIVGDHVADGHNHSTS
jgi:CO dehydrogenase nickel-insertion accessory protein CooC1